MERIVLKDGPGDGKRYEWDGGDVLKYAVSGRNPEKVYPDLFVVIERDDATYRRSLVTPEIFVFQP